MRRSRALVMAALSAVLPCEGAASLSDYVDPAGCAPCHRQIWDSYRQTAMGRSFSRTTAAALGDLSRKYAYYHEASDQHFTLVERDGHFFQRRHQVGPDGRKINVIEMEIDYVLGSGEHARTYVHRTIEGRLIELPLAWYNENGGTLAMNPGYDRPDHMDFRRKLDRECFFCHNAYPRAVRGVEPELVLPAAIPEGIDCQRCHGPGRTHVQVATAGRSTAEIRAAIVNPARLTAERQNEVCFQCHLESTSHRLPYALRRFGRDVFSYRPGEPLSEHILHFDHVPGAGYDDKFEIDHAAYRMLKSACYRQSGGALTCITCHDPHRQPRGEEAARRYQSACLGCHGEGKADPLRSDHPAVRGDSSCVRCHMVKRRADDVVHVVMTDHFIQRAPATPDLAAALRESHDDRGDAYRGKVVLLYPSTLPPGPAPDLYTALAQVADGANYGAGLPALRAAIEKWRPSEPEFYFELANAYWKTGEAADAFLFFRETLRRNPEHSAARRNYALALMENGRVAEAVRMLEAGSPLDAATMNTLGAAFLAFGKPERSVATLRSALKMDDAVPEAYINLANALSKLGDTYGAIEALARALQLQPGSAAAHTNLASLLAGKGDFDGAAVHFERAIRIDPDSVVARYNYGRVLVERKQFHEAEMQLRAALRLDPRHAEAAVALGLALMQTGRLPQAAAAYRQAIRSKPNLIAARYNLALALLAGGETTAAIEQLEAVVQAAPADYEAHLRLGKALLAAGSYQAAIAHLRTATQSPSASVRDAAQDALRKAMNAR